MIDLNTESFYVVPEVIHKWNTQKYQVIVCGRRVRCVVMGETHYVSENISMQSSLIELIRPEVVLHEAGNGWLYDPQGCGYSLQPGRAIQTGIDDCGTSDLFPTRLIEQAHLLNHKLVGIDMTITETEQAYHQLAIERPKEFLWEQIGDFPVYCLVKKGSPNYKFTALDPITFKLRDAHMVRMIQRWEKISQAPLIVIVGSNHARNFHEKGLLRACRFRYAIVNQTRVRIRSR